MERNLTRRLRLDDGQQLKLHQILSDAPTAVKAWRRDYQPQIFEPVNNADGQCIAMLTPSNRRSLRS